MNLRLRIDSLAIELPEGARLTAGAQRQLLADVQEELIRHFHSEGMPTGMADAVHHDSLSVTARDLGVRRGLAGRIAGAVYEGLNR